MKKILVGGWLIIFIAGCVSFGGPRRVHYPHQLTPELQASFHAAETLYQQKRFTAADVALAQFIEQSPYTELTDEARFLRGEIAFIRKHYAQAVEQYRSAYAQLASPEVEPKARFKAALALSRLGRPSEALLELQGIRREEASSVLKLRIDSLGAVASRDAKRPTAEAIVWSLYLLDDYAEGAPTGHVGVPGERIVPAQEAHDQVKAWIDDPSVSAAMVEALPLEAMKGKRSGGYALYKQALAYHSEGNARAATKLLKSYITSYPKHEYYGSARLLMSELGGVVGEAAGIAVGAVLPLSGKYGVYGQSVQHGLECAIGLYAPCIGPAGVRLVIRDSLSFPGGAAAAVEDIARDEEVVAIVGPLLSAQALEVANKAQQLGMPLISLSQRDGVPEVGDYIFRNSSSTASEMDSLAAYAVQRKGLRRFFVLYPNGGKGGEYLRLFSSATERLGAKVVRSRPFAPGQLRVTNELRGRGAVELAVERTGDVSDGGVAYDALFIPGSIWEMGSILKMREMTESPKVPLLGISRWNDARLVENGGEDVEGAIFVTSFYRESPMRSVADFVSRISRAYGIDPTLLEALGYDSMRMITAAVQDTGAIRRQSMRDALAKTVNFPGVSGETSFNQTGDAERKMWVLTVKQGKIVPAE